MANALRKKRKVGEDGVAGIDGIIPEQPEHGAFEFMATGGIMFGENEHPYQFPAGGRRVMSRKHVLVEPHMDVATGGLQIERAIDVETGDVMEQADASARALSLHRTGKMGMFRGTNRYVADLIPPLPFKFPSPHGGLPERIRTVVPWCFEWEHNASRKVYEFRTNSPLDPSFDSAHTAPHHTFWSTYYDRYQVRKTDWRASVRNVAVTGGLRIWVYEVHGNRSMTGIIPGSINSVLEQPGLFRHVRKVDTKGSVGDYIVMHGTIICADWERQRGDKGYGADVTANPAEAIHQGIFLNDHDDFALGLVHCLLEVEFQFTVDYWRRVHDA